MPASCVIYLWATSISETTTEGTAYGFEIGQSKADAYRAAQDQFELAAIYGVEAVRTREDEDRLHPGAGDYYSAEELEHRFNEWNHWSLWLGASNTPPIGLILFEGDSISSTGLPGATCDSWHPPGAPAGIVFSKGQTYAEAYALLASLSRSPGFSSLLLRSGWMARRQPDKLAASEFDLIKPYDRWKIFMSSERSYFDDLDLTFEDQRLVEIYRHRQEFEDL